MKLVKTFALIFIITVIIASFQNCSQQQGTTLLGESSSNASQADTVATSAPFAYDLVADTISYNSCVGQDLNNAGIHGLKIGVNEGFADALGSGVVKAGIKLNTDFLNYIGKNLSPIYPSTVITPGQIQYVLQNSKANKDMFIQYAVRRRSDLSVVMDLISPGSGSVVTPSRDGLVESAALSMNPVLTALTKNIQFSADGSILSEGPRVYNLYEPNAARAIEASFGFSNYADDTYPATNGNSTLEPFGFGEAYSDRVRQKFNASSSDKYLLTITYGNPQAAASSDYGLSTPQRPSDTDKTKAYGRSYALRFDQAGSKAGWRPNLLKQVVESNLSDSSPVSRVSWSCENFVIMKQNQWNNTQASEPACAPLITSDLQNAVRAQQVKRLRRHYSDSDWNIGLFYNKNASYDPAGRANQPLCLVPKNNECYLSTTIGTTDIGINYDTSTECYLYAASVMGVSYTGNPAIDAQRQLGRCAQYASLCIRQ